MRLAYVISIAIAAAVAVAVVLASGVLDGEPSREDFQADVVYARNRTDASLEYMAKARTWEDLLERIEAAGDQARSAGGDLDDAGSPSELQEEATELESALRALGDELSATAEALEATGLEDANIQGLNFDNWNRVQKALAALRAQGIEVRPLERY